MSVVGCLKRQLISLSVPWLKSNWTQFVVSILWREEEEDLIDDVLGIVKEHKEEGEEGKILDCFCFYFSYSLSSCFSFHWTTQCATRVSFSSPLIKLLNASWSRVKCVYISSRYLHIVDELYLDFIHPLLNTGRRTNSSHLLNIRTEDHRCHMGNW